MEWLSGWLKAVILVILLATFIDLLLPNHSMQRYVKTVMSLFLLLTLLQPILSLFENHTRIEEILAGALFKQGDELTGMGDAGAMESLASIRQRAETLRVRQEQETRRLAETQAANLIKRKIEQTAGVKVQQVHVQTETDKNGQAVINQMSLTIALAAAADSGQGKTKPAAAMEPVKPVEPVTPPDIRIGSTDARTSPAARIRDGETDSLPPELSQKKTQILLMLEQDWQLPRDRIALTIEQGR